MLGLQYLKRIAQLINDSHPSESWLDKRHTFDLLYDAAKEYCEKTGVLRDTQNITTIAPGTITAATQANPCQITCASHGLSDGDTVFIAGVTGMTELNNRRYVITYVSANAFTLNGINSTGYTAYSSAGTVYPLSYQLNYDFGSLWQVNPDTGAKCIQFLDGSSTRFVDQIDYDEIVHDDDTEPGTYPVHFSILPRYSMSAQVTGTTTSAGSATGGESTLTDSAATFTTKIKPGDEIINKTQNYLGFVLSVTSDTALKTAMFNYSSNQTAYAGWGSGESYAIVPRPRFQLLLDAPLSVGNDTITVPYLQIPDPVYSLSLIHI